MDERVRSGLKELRLFGLGFGASFGVLAWRSWRHGGEAWPWLLGVMGALWLLAASEPRALSPLHHVLSSLVVRWLPSAFLHSFYWLVFTPYAWLVRLLGTSLLDTKLRDRDSYWVPKAPNADLDAYRRQF
jgi:hypothetical protein